MKKNTKKTGRIIRSCFAAALAVVLAVPVSAISTLGTINAPIEVEAADVELPDPVMSLDFERGFKGENVKNGLKVKESKERLMFEEYKVNDNYVKDENGEWIFKWTDTPVIYGTEGSYYYQKGTFGNQPTTYDDPEKGNVFRLDGSMEADWIIKTESDKLDYEVPVYTGGFDDEGNPLDEEAAKKSTLQVAHTAHSAVQINNPFAGMDFTEEYDDTDEEGPQWTKGVTIAYWVKVPTVEPEEDEEVDDEEILNDSVLITFENIQRDEDGNPVADADPTYEVNGWIKYEAARKCNPEDEEYDPNYLNDPMYAQGTLSTITDMNDAEKTYNVLSDYGPLVRLTPEYPGSAENKIYFRDDTKERTPDATVNIIENGKQVTAKLYELGPNIYKDYCTLDIDKGSLVARGYINGSMQISASNAFHFKEDDFYSKVTLDENGNDLTIPVSGAMDANPNNKENQGVFKQFRYYNTFYFQGDATVTDAPDEWHYVTCVIQNDWVQFYVDGEEIEADDYGYHGESFCSLNGKKYFNKGYGIRYPYQIGWSNVAEWIKDGTFSSGPSNCVPQTMLEWISNPDTVLYLGYQGICAESLEQDFGTLEGAMMDDITFYAVPLTSEQATELYNKALDDKDAQANKAVEPIKVYDFDSDTNNALPAGMTAVSTNDASVESPAVVNEAQYGHVLKLGASKSAKTSAVTFENPFKGRDDIEGATISYWAKTVTDEKGKVSDGLGITFMDEPKILEHGKIQDAVADTVTRTGLYAKLSCDATFMAGIDSKVYDSLKNNYSTSTLKNGFTDKKDTASFEQDAYDLEQEWKARLNSMTEWHYVTMVVENSGITMYFDGEKLDNNQHDKTGPTFYGPRFYDGYYHKMLDSFASIKFGTGNQMATSLMEFLTQSDTAGYFGLMYKLGSSTTYMTTALSFFDDVAFYDKALSDDEVKTIYADAKKSAESKSAVAGEDVYTSSTDKGNGNSGSDVKDPKGPEDGDNKQVSGFNTDANGKLTATANGVTITADSSAIPSGAQLVVNILGAKDSADRYTSAGSLLKNASINVDDYVNTIYDIHLEVNGQTVAPTGSVKVTLTPPSGYQAAKTSIVRLSDVKSMSTSVSGSSLVYDTESLGDFAILQKKGANVSGNTSTSGSATAGKTGDNVSVVVPVILLSVAFVVIAVLRKKEEYMED